MEEWTSKEVTIILRSNTMDIIIIVKFKMTCQVISVRWTNTCKEREWSHSVVSDSLWPHGLSPNQAPPSMEFSKQEYWSGLPFPSPGDCPDLAIEPGSPILQADTLPSEPPGNFKNQDPAPNYPVSSHEAVKPSPGGVYPFTKPHVQGQE